MKKSIILLVAVLFFGILAADAAWRHPVAAYAAAQTGDEADQQKDNQGGGNGHLGHH